MFVWIYCLSITVPPIFGWSKYVLEGFETSCSWDYTTKTLSNRLFYIYMLVLGFILPVSIITYCYIFIIVSILDHNKEMAGCNSNIRALDTGKRVSSKIRQLAKNVILYHLTLPFYLYRYDRPVLITV